MEPIVVVMTKNVGSDTKQLHRSPLRTLVVFSVAFGVLCVMIDWLILGDMSPLSDSFLDSVSLRNFVRQLHLPTYFLLVFLQPDPPLDEIVAYGSVFLQWFVISLLVGLAIYGLRQRR